jgi:hypothetical protein
MGTWRRTFALILVLAVTPAVARAQVSLGGGVTVGGEVTATFGAHDVENPEDPQYKPAYFNYTDYAHNALRMFRVSLTGMWQPADQFAFLAELRSENLDQVTPYALYVRVRPWKNHPFDVQAGRIPSVFGAYVRRYGTSDNPLIGVPLVYQYLTSLRPDATPASADGLLFYRGLGWQVAYPVGDPTRKPGVPLMTAYQWDTGVQAHVGGEYVQGSVAITSGTLANPRVDDNNDGRQWSGRVSFTPVAGLVIGASASNGEFLAREITDAYNATFHQQNHYTQRGLGLDAEYSRGYWILRGELIDSRWNLPKINNPPIDRPLHATGGFLEGRYRLSPRYYVAGRVDRLTFTRILGQKQPTGGGAGTWTPWDAPVNRVELGGGVNITRHVIGRGVLQYNWREGPVQFIATKRLYASGQLSFWF